MRKILLVPFFFFFFTSIYSQTCSPNQVELVLRVETDRFAENSWTLASGDSIYAMVDDSEYFQKEIFLDTFCIIATECLTFTIFDSFGDGILSGGGFEIYIEDSLVLKENMFGFTKTYEINCLPGTTCSKAMDVAEGDHQAPSRDSWYRFTPDTVGTYTISTCDRNDCDTKIWVYDRCESYVLGNLEGFIFFDDNSGNCGFQAVVNAFFKEGESYLIRISDVAKDCGGPINWSINYQGPVIGCTDPNSCNFNPLATIDDGSCRPQGDPLCPNGPDFKIREDILLASIAVDTLFSEDNCWIEEGCLKGIGLREIIRFTTRFENIGELDYYIGQPSLENDQFVFDNCHNHFHYENYAEYLLFDSNGNSIPNGYKSGFCLIDLSCPTGNNKYGCANMGLSVGCYDEYSSELDCQWIDVTDIPDGDITFIARINWKNQPDALGRVEKNLDNNWAQACLTLDRSSGQLQVTIKEDCPIFRDCEGTLYGNVLIDCEGVCGGSAIMGDVNNSQDQSKADVQSYFTAILDKEIAATPCNDLNGDERLTVYDAAILSDCINFEQGHLHPNNLIHSHCEFPSGVYNPNEIVNLTIHAVNPDQKYVDIAIRNPDSDIVGYQFTLSGVQIQQLESLVDVKKYPALLQANMATGEIIGLSLQDSSIEKSRELLPFLRVYFTSYTDDFVCLENIAEVVNRSYQQVPAEILGNCVNAIISSTNDLTQKKSVKVRPNPFTNTSTLSFSNPNQENYTLLVNDLAGRTLKKIENIRTENIELSREGLINGIYYFQLIGKEKTLTGKLVVQ